MDGEPQSLIDKVLLLLFVHEKKILPIPKGCTQSMKFRPLVLAAMFVLSVCPPSTHAQTIPLQTATIQQLDAELAAGRLTSVQLVRFYLQRIRRLNKTGPALHAIIAINPDAIAEAQASDRERRQRRPRGPLEGIPILIKDNIETADPMATTAGSLALADNITHRDSPLVARLRAAGAIILGKTNLSEWADLRSGQATSGWSAVGGLARNPYALDRSACGSSSGSGVAVAAGLAAAAVGTETDGSITCPSSMNGLTGLKPSVGQIPRTYVVPIAHSQDTPGPIARTAADAALMMAVMSGPDPRDPASLDHGAVPGPAFSTVTPANLRGVRLGVLRFANDSVPIIDPAYNAALARLSAAGAVLVEVKLPDQPKIETDELLVLETEMKVDLSAYLRGAAPGLTVRSLADLIAFNQRTPAELHLFGQDLFVASQATKGLDDPAYLSARAESLRLTGAEGIDKLLQDNHLDALVAPTTGPTWKMDFVYGDTNPAAFTTFPAIAGYPHLSTPMGTVHGLPVGLSIIGPKWSDAKVLALGEAWQAISPPVPPPTFPATVDPAP